MVKSNVTQALIKSCYSLVCVVLRLGVAALAVWISKRSPVKTFSWSKHTSTQFSSTIMFVCLFYLPPDIHFWKKKNPTGIVLTFHANTTAAFHLPAFL